LKSSGIEVGKSICEDKLIYSASKILSSAFMKNVLMPMPTDVIVSECPENVKSIRITNVENIKMNEMILDFGPKSLNSLKLLVRKSKTIMWNGPLGLFEIDEFSNGTKEIAQEIALSDAYTIIGGGDTISALNKFNVIDKINYVSTGGGAFLEFLQNSNLPAISALLGKD
jgi:phosphoglycerate kinase